MKHLLLKGTEKERNKETKKHLFQLIIGIQESYGISVEWLHDDIMI